MNNDEKLKLTLSYSTAQIHHKLNLLASSMALFESGDFETTRSV